MYSIKFLPSAVVDTDKLAKSGDKLALKRLKTLLDELKEHPKTGTGKPEQLKGDKRGRWSRRITEKHRLVYEIYEMEVIIIVISAYGHYNDK